MNTLQIAQETLSQSQCVQQAIKATIIVGVLASAFAFMAWRCRRNMDYVLPLAAAAAFLFLMTMPIIGAISTVKESSQRLALILDGKFEVKVQDIGLNPDTAATNARPEITLIAETQKTILFGKVVQAEPASYVTLRFNEAVKLQKLLKENRPDLLAYFMAARTDTHS